MANDLISSKVYKLLEELNIPNEDIQRRPEIVEKIIDLCWSNQIQSTTAYGSTKVELADTSKRQSSELIIQYVDYWIDDSIGSLKEVLYCVQDKLNEVIDVLNSQ